MPANQNIIRPERRNHTRHKAKASVYIQFPQKAAKRYVVGNLSAAGVFILTEGLGLPIGTEVSLVFTLNVGDLKKLHRRQGLVIHKSSGGTGLHMSPQRKT